MKKNNILTIMKKEFRRFFGDRRMVLTILLPGILIYVIYSLMGSTLSDSIKGEEQTTYSIQFENLSAPIHDRLHEAADTAGISFRSVWVENPKKDIAEDAIHLYVVIPEHFDELVAAYDPASGEPAPAVEIYYNSASLASQAAYSFVVSVLDTYESALANRMDINPDPSVSYDLAKPENVTGMLFSMLMPLLLMMLMFSGCMAMTTESIAGEKERGTIATLLVTPVKRGELAVGKIAALSIISLLAGLCSFLGVLLSLPGLMGAEGMDSGLLDASVYSVGDYLMLLPVILSTVLVFVSIISVISALAGSVKEATGMVTPLMLLVTVIGVMGMFTGGDHALWQFCIPIYNSVGCISGIFSMDYHPVHILITALSNFVSASLCVLLLTRMFRSEKIMFKK